MSDLKKTLYGKNRFVAFLDGFRLNILYRYVFDKCDDRESKLIYDEVVFIEQRSYYEYSGNTNKPKFSDVLKQSLQFVFPKASLRIDMFSYLSLETAYVRAKTGKCFLLSRYKLNYINEYMKTRAYKNIYNKFVRTRDIVSNAILNFTYSVGDTDARSSDLDAKLLAERHHDVIIV